MATYGPEALLCHCHDDNTGHPLGVDECAEKPLTVRASVSWPDCSDSDHLFGFTYHRTPVTGTCGECGRAGVRVDLHVVRVTGPADEIPPLRDGKGIPLGQRPRLAPHKATRAGWRAMPRRGPGSRGDPVQLPRDRRMDPRLRAGVRGVTPGDHPPN